MFNKQMRLALEECLSLRHLQGLLAQNLDLRQNSYILSLIWRHLELRVSLFEGPMLLGVLTCRLLLSAL
jgi:hypothetical protein